MSQTYTIHKDIIHTIFKKLIDANAFTQKKNAKTALQLIIDSLDETAIENVASLMLKEEVYSVLSKGDYVEVEAPAYHAGSEYEEDVLYDMGLLNVNGDTLELSKTIVYGKVIDDTSWSSDKPFKPFYSNVKVDLLYHDKDKVLKHFSHNANPLYLKKISKYDIPYYRMQEEVNYKQHVDSLVDTHLGTDEFADKIKSGEFKVVDYDVNDKQPH
jgi:hypothetical protein|tara:strand:+ start:80 stop:721 length:642 start_codon:yes stop_codon:yes gene_type:complete